MHSLQGTNALDFVGERAVSDDALERWRGVMADMFGPPNRLEDDDAGADDQEEKSDTRAFLEPCVDEMRAQKNAGLIAYKKEVQRKIDLEISGKRGSSRSRTSSKTKASRGASPTAPSGGQAANASSSSSSSSSRRK